MNLSDATGMCYSAMEIGALMAANGLTKDPSEATLADMMALQQRMAEQGGLLCPDGSKLTNNNADNQTPIAQSTSSSSSPKQTAQIIGKALNLAGTINGAVGVTSDAAAIAAGEAKAGSALANIAPFAEGVSFGGLIAAVVIDGAGVITGTVTIAHATEDTAVGAAAWWIGGVPGAVLGAAYFGIDAFYPGGVNQAASDVIDAIGPQPFTYDPDAHGWIGGGQMEDHSHSVTWGM